MIPPALSPSILICSASVPASSILSSAAAFDLRAPLCPPPPSSPPSQQLSDVDVNIPSDSFSALSLSLQTSNHASSANASAVFPSVLPSVVSSVCASSVSSVLSSSSLRSSVEQHRQQWLMSIEEMEREQHAQQSSMQTDFGLESVCTNFHDMFKMLANNVYYPPMTYYNNNK